MSGWGVKGMPQNMRVTKQIAGQAKKTKQGIRKGFYYLGTDLMKTSRKLIKEPPKTGILYKIRRLKRLVRHQASAPGEAPANLSGKLRRSLDFIVSGGESMEYGVRGKKMGPIPGVKYGGALEKGTNRAGRNHTTKIKPRPYLSRSIKENYRNAQRHLSREINKELTKKT